MTPRKIVTISFFVFHTVVLVLIAICYQQVATLQRKVFIINLYLGHESKERVVELLGPPSRTQFSKPSRWQSKSTLYYWSDNFYSSGVALGFDENNRLMEYHYEP